jgi:tetratricopeptide (TPR) repeat protein
MTTLMDKRQHLLSLTDKDDRFTLGFMAIDGMGGKNWALAFYVQALNLEQLEELPEDTLGLAAKKISVYTDLKGQIQWHMPDMTDYAETVYELAKKCPADELLKPLSYYGIELINAYVNLGQFAKALELAKEWENEFGTSLLKAEIHFKIFRPGLGQKFLNEAFARATSISDLAYFAAVLSDLVKFGLKVDKAVKMCQKTLKKIDGITEKNHDPIVEDNIEAARNFVTEHTEKS